MTPQAPLMDRPAVEQPQTQPGAPVTLPPPPATAPIAGYGGPVAGQTFIPQSGWYGAPAVPRPAPSPFVSPGMRLALAITSMALFIPLLAISLGVISSLATLTAPGVAITIGLVLVGLVAGTIVAINLVFNADQLGLRR